MAAIAGLGFEKAGVLRKKRPPEGGLSNRRAMPAGISLDAVVQVVFQRVYEGAYLDFFGGFQLSMKVSRKSRLNIAL